LVNRVVAGLHDHLGDRPGHAALFRAPLGLGAWLVAGPLLGSVAGLADRAHDRLADGLVADVETFFRHGVPAALVAGAGLLLTGVEAALGVTGGSFEDPEACVAAMGSPRAGSGPEQANHRHQPRR